MITKMKKITLTTLIATLAIATAQAGPATTVTGITFDPAYRNWTAVAPSHRVDKGHMRMMLANPIMVKAYREGILPFPDGSVMAKLVYKAEKSPEWASAIVPGEALSVEFIVKDSKKYKKTGGWEFGRFSPEGEPLGDMKLYATCFPCHKANVKDHDYIFTRWAK